MPAMRAAKEYKMEFLVVRGTKDDFKFRFCDSEYE